MDGYRGTVNKTKDGRDCKTWKSLRQVTGNSYGYVENENRNFCRNPDKSPGGPWCFDGRTANISRTGACGIPECGLSVFFLVGRYLPNLPFEIAKIKPPKL